MSWACGGMVRREILRPVLLRRLKHRRRPIQRLSMEFLIGRSLANNIVNLSLAPFFDRIPFDRPVVGYGGKTINTLRLLVGRCCR